MPDHGLSWWCGSLAALNWVEILELWHDLSPKLQDYASLMKKKLGFCDTYEWWVSWSRALTQMTDEAGASSYQRNP